MAIEPGDRLLELLRDGRLRVGDEPTALGPPSFPMPARAAEKLELAMCAGCGFAIVPGAHAAVVWRNRVFHDVCAHDELIALRSAA